MIRLERYNYWKLLSIALILFLAFSCSKDDDIIQDDPPPNNQEPVKTSKTFIYDTFKDKYFWIEELPDLDPNTFSTDNDLVNALRYKELDRWSFVTDLDEYLALFQNAQTKGFGVRMAYIPVVGDGDHRLMVGFTYDKAPMGLAGVKRGWEFFKIDDKPIANFPDYKSILAEFDTDSEVKFTFITLENDTVDHSMTRTDYEINTVLHKSVHDVDGRKVGYLVFESFLAEPSVNALEDAFEFFVTESVEELIIDLRYNGGGSVNTAYHLLAQVGGSDVLNKNLLVAYIYNSKRSSENQGLYLGENYPVKNWVNLDRLFFITTESSASASEMVINSMLPYKEVKLIGEKTHGKPVGMEPEADSLFNLLVAPISFQLVNADMEGDYFSGIPVDYEVDDDVFHAWGDPNEACLKQALQIIAGNDAPVALKSASVRPVPPPLKRGLQEITGAY